VSVNLENEELRVEGKIDPDGISADLADGVLTLTLQKAKEAMPRRIPIK